MWSAKWFATIFGMCVSPDKLLSLRHVTYAFVVRRRWVYSVNTYTFSRDRRSPFSELDKSLYWWSDHCSNSSSRHGYGGDSKFKVDWVKIAGSCRTLSPDRERAASLAAFIDCAQPETSAIDRQDILVYPISKEARSHRILE